MSAYYKFGRNDGAFFSSPPMEVRPGIHQSNRVNVSTASGSNVVGERCWHRAQKRIKGATRRCYGTGSPVKMVARSGYEIPRLPVGSRARGVVRGVPRFFKIEISNDVWRKMMLKMEFFRRRKELDANGWMKRERNWICFEYCIIM